MTYGWVSKFLAGDVFLIPVGEVFHELRTFVERGVRDVGIVQPSDKVGDRLEVLLVHPFVYAREDLRDQFRPMRIERATHLYGGSAGQEALDDVFPIVHTRRGRDRDVRELPGDDGRPAERIAQIPMVAKHIARYDLERIDIDVWPIEAVEEHHAVRSVGMELVHEGGQVRGIFPELDRHRDRDFLLDLLQDVDI